jgi:hypothetical protein
VGLPSIAEQAELMLDAQKRRAAGGQVGLLDMYSRTAEAANKQSATQAQSFVSTFKQATTPPAAQVAAGTAKPAEAAPLNMSVAARYRKKGRA